MKYKQTESNINRQNNKKENDMKIYICITIDLIIQPSGYMISVQIHFPVNE